MAEATFRPLLSNIVFSTFYYALYETTLHPSVEQENATTHLTLRPILQKSFTNTYGEGIGFMGYVKIKDKILNRTTDTP